MKLVSRYKLARVIVPVALAGLVLAACGGDDPEPEATDTEDTAPADDEADEADDDAAADDGDDAADDGDDTAAEPEGDDVIAPIGNEVVVAFSSIPQVEKVPSVLALEAMAADGFETDTIYLQSSEDPIQAVVRGDANFGSASASAVFTAIGAGAPLVAIAQQNGPNYVLVAPVGTGDPGGLDGLRTGIHAPVSSTTLYTRLALADFPDAEPEILVVPGSANRIQALAADELDASVVQIADLPRLEDLAAGRFETIWNFGLENPELVDSVLFTSLDMIESDPGLVQAYIEYNLRANAEAYEDIDTLTDAIVRIVAETDEELGRDLAQLHIEAQLWPVDGGLTLESIQATIQALVDNELMETAPELSTLFDRGPLDAVLARS